MLRNPGRVLGAVFASLSFCTALPALAQDYSGAWAQRDWTDRLVQPDPYDRAVFFFGGRFHSDYFGGSFNAFGAPYETNYVLGGGYQHFFQNWGDFRLGAEGGLALRFGEGEPTSLEAWGGVVGRYDGFVIGNTIRISPSMTFGLSAVTDTIGMETVRASWIESDVPVLFYLGPEISISSLDNPNLEAFWRVQHRSGAWGTIAHIDGSNANTVGVRWKF
ncbi:hypothetical protein SAMN02983003_2931 [Devosia enhydra]|uniref:Outer membrane protein beta-barrel domain-containing protein n=1 Tax=Devosia enhydra TaxID=665118 RepID=A0A1K2I0A8_9HYPH|nr:hypothetical protein [Devosia enhydra]SFZ85761.1 hypothetical protein SAMN02983003_2931 [Devosia enhydra]